MNPGRWKIGLELALLELESRLLNLNTGLVYFNGGFLYLHLGSRGLGSAALECFKPALGISLGGGLTYKRTTCAFPVKNTLEVFDFLHN